MSSYHHVLLAGVVSIEATDDNLVVTIEISNPSCDAAPNGKHEPDVLSNVIVTDESLENTAYYHVTFRTHNNRQASLRRCQHCHEDYWEVSK